MDNFLLGLNFAWSCDILCILTLVRYKLMGAFLHGGVVPMIPNNENGVLEKKGFPTFLIPDVIAHVRG